MDDESIISRILSKSEIAQLDSLLVPHLSKKYPNFEKWLEKAKNEIETGERFALGEWMSYSLISTVILKPTVSNTVELKSFFVDPKFRQLGHGGQLYEKAEKQCLKMEFKKIIVDAFCEDEEVIIFLIGHGYEIFGREDLYSVGRFSYLLSKDLKPTYTGDPFDWEEIANWLIENYLDFEIVEKHPVVEQRALDFKIKKSIGEGVEIIGLVEVKDTTVDQDPVSMLLQKTKDGGYHVPIFVGRKFKDRARNFAEEKGVILLDEDDIHRITGWKPPIIKRENIRGMILPIKPEFYEKILRKDAKEFIFFKGAPVGKYLSKNDKIFFYVESPRKEIYAVATVTNATIETPERQWGRYGENSVFEEREYWRFARTKRGILAIELEKFREFTPIKEEELKKIIPQRFLSGAYVDDAIVSELER